MHLFTIIVLFLSIISSSSYSATFSDNFASTNISVWNYDPYTSIDNGRLKIQLPNSVTWSGAHSLGKMYIYGDFEYQVDYNSASMSSNNGWHVLMRAQTDDNKIVEIKRAYYGSNVYDGSYYNGSTWQSWNPISTSDTSGKLKIRRSGTNFYIYYWDSVDSRWEYNNNTNGYLVSSAIGTAPVFFFLATGTQTNTFTATSYFDNFSVSADGISPELSSYFLLFLGITCLYSLKNRKNKS